MPTLPIDIVYSVVDELANDKKTLLTLLLVCHDFNRRALRILYRDLSFDIAGGFHTLYQLERLSRVIEDHPCIQHTEGFAISFPATWLMYDEAYEYCKVVIPALVNLRRLSILRPPGDFVTTTTLRLVSSSVQLTHLDLGCMLDSDDFVTFLDDHPSLQRLAVRSFTDDFERTPASTRRPRLPNLRSLLIPADILLFTRFGNMPSLVDLTLLSSINQDTFQIEYTKPFADAFPTIRTLSTAGLDFPSVSALVPLLPNLQYLSPSDCPPPKNHVFAGLTLTTLKYIQLDSVFRPLIFSRALFSAVETLLVIDFRIKEYGKVKGCQRVYRHSSNKIVLVKVVKGIWEWWEPAEKDLRGQIGPSLA